VREETDRLLQKLNDLRTPLRVSVRSIVAESDRISNSEDTALQPSEWLSTRKRIADLSTQFKQLSTVTAPLREAAASLQSAHSALDEWRAALDGEYKSTIHYLAVRLGMLLGAVLFVLLASAIWQRAIFRYVNELRRRRQLLLIKRVVVGFSLALLVALGFFSSFGSVATLLGFVTAGLALVLQNVVLSAVAYFFPVGRYGLKVSDRVTVQGVTGQVIEVGLIRLFLMELVGTGTDTHPTGRLAVFANSVIFQPAALMKQAPGMDYAWHTVTATVEDPIDYQQTRDRLTKAVTSVYEDYRQAIEQQHRVFERSTDLQTSTPTPVSRTQFSQTGLEITIRYPISLGEPGDIDERIIARLMDETGHDPKLKFTPGGSPKIAQVV
jgi:small-conductance mechanosensitive channel